MVIVSRIILLNFDCSAHIKAWLHLVYVLLLLLLCFLPVVSTKLLQYYHLPILYPPICPYTLVNLTKMVLGLAVDTGFDMFLLSLFIIVGMPYIKVITERSFTSPLVNPVVVLEELLEF